PLAMPVIMSGIRTAAVLIIGTATLATLIGAGGLGSFILLGIDRNNASNTYAVAVPKKIAQEYGLKTISDLKKVEGQLKAGFTLEFNDREDGNKGLQSMYGLNLNVATMQPALRYQAIQSGDIQITDAYSTDA
uniref:glycine betaine ABC transporter substrate-binding protein n=1 Tax=Streptococcus pneumoniae TaxID=1313 RepID=UPI000A92583C